MTLSKPTAFALTLLLTLARARDGRADVSSVATQPSTGRVVLSSGAAAIIGVGFWSFRAAGGVSLGAQEDWAVHRRLRLGLAQAITAASIPYWNVDPVVSEGGPQPFGGTYRDAAFLTRLLATVTVDLDRVQLDAGIGTMFLLSPTMGADSIFPNVVAQAGVAVPLGARGAPALLRLGVWRSTGVTFDPGESIVVPELTLGFPL